MARFGGSDIVSPGRASEAIASLPVAALRLPGSVISSLHDVGIERVAQIASKPRAGLRLRFGRDVLLRFDQALGSAQEALTSLIPPEVPRSELRFAEPVADPEVPPPPSHFEPEGRKPSVTEVEGVRSAGGWEDG